MGHTHANVLIHVIFGTKHRRGTILESFRPRLYEYMAGVANQEVGYALRIGGTNNHVHGLLRLRTDVSVAEAMKKWKSLSSGWAHKTIAEARDLSWQTGYGVFSVSQSNVSKVIEYIEGQAEHHRERSFEEEYIEFLRRHEIEFDPARVWDEEFA